MLLFILHIKPISKYAKNKSTAITQMRAGATVLLSKHKPFVSIPPKEDTCVCRRKIKFKNMGFSSLRKKQDAEGAATANLPLPPHLSPHSSREALGFPRSTRSVTHIPLAEKSSPAVSCTKQTGAIEHSATKCSVPTGSQGGKAANQPGFSKSD